MRSAVPPPKYALVLARALIPVFGLLAGAAAAVAAESGFSTDTAEAQVRKTFPDIRRVSDELPPGVLAQENVVYAPAGGSLALDVYRPSKPGRRPAVIVVHGGGWESGSRLMERPLAKRLAARGYVAVPVSYHLGAAGRFPNALYDLKTAVRWLRAHADDYEIDAAHVGAIGASSGGQLVALLGASNGEAELEGEGGATGFSSAVQAVVDIDGLVDFTEPGFVAAQAANPSAPTRFLGGPFAERADVWRAASALAHVHAGSAPTLFLNSTAPTPIVPGRPAMLARLHALGIESELITFPHTPHPFWLFHPWFEAVVDEADQFLYRHLCEAPPSATATQ